MANVIFNRSDNALAEPVEDGKLTFSTNGDGKMYLDKGNRRLEMGGAKTIDAYPSKESVNAIQNKAVTNNFPQNTDVVNNLQSAISVTEDNIPCGTKPIREMNAKLRANNTDFIFDYQFGEYGYNTSPSRGADTFHPFKKSESGILFTSSPVDMKQYTKKWRGLGNADFKSVITGGEVCVWSRPDCDQGCWSFFPNSFSYDNSTGILSFGTESKREPTSILLYSYSTAVFWYGTVGGKR